MEAIEHIVPAARAHLLPGGWLLLEHGALQGRSTRDVLEHSGFEAVHTLPDLQGLDRVTLGRQPG
jgi:release factor glutamine methyltransferase